MGTVKDDRRWVGLIESTPFCYGYFYDMFVGVDKAEGSDRQSWLVWKKNDNGELTLIACGDGEIPQMWLTE
jgi:hypothetical protein